MQAPHDLHGCAGCRHRSSISHAVERAVDEEQRRQEERHRQDPRQRAGTALGEVHAELHRQQTEQGGELDDRVHRDRRRVLERIADGVAHHRGVVEGVPFILSSVSTIFLALSQAPPALAMKMAWNRPNSAIEIR